MELESRKGRGMERHQRKSRRKRNGRFPYLLQIREDTICKNNVGCHSQSRWDLCAQGEEKEARGKKYVKSLSLVLKTCTTIFFLYVKFLWYVVFS